MKKISLICLLFISFAVTSSFAQSNHIIDSLLTVLKTAKEDTNKVNLLVKIGKKYIKERDYDNALTNEKQALLLAQKLKWKKGEAKAYNSIGDIYEYQGKYSEAITNFSASLKIRIERGDKKGMSVMYNNIGLMYSNLGKYPEALKNYSASFDIDNSLGDKSGMATFYSNIANLYYFQGNYPDALKNHFAALKIREELKDKISIAQLYNNIGSIYQYQGNFSDALKNYFVSVKMMETLGDEMSSSQIYSNIGAIYEQQGKYTEALKNYFYALKIQEKIDDKSGLSYTYHNIGIVYDQQGNYSEALKMYFSSLNLQEELGDKVGIVSCLMNLGTLYIQLRQYPKAQGYLNQSLQLSKELGSKDAIKGVYHGLAELDSALGNYKSQVMHYKLFILYRDSLNNEETQKKTIQSAMTYEFEKKELATKAGQEKKDAVSAAEKKREKIIRYSVVSGLALMVLIALLIFRSLRITRKQKSIIETQKLTVDAAHHQLEEKHKEITDSINYAERIQRSFLATTEMLDQHLKDYFVFFRPKDVVSGDFYWAGKLNNGNFALATADSTGHGVPGAIMSILNISSLEKSIENETNPDQILNTTRKIIIERLKKDGSTEGGKDGMDCSLLVINPERTHLSFAAANNPVFIIRNNELMEYKADKMPVGKHDRDSESFTLHTISLQKGDIIYTLTDGFPDQFGGDKGKKYMIKNLKALIMQIAHLSLHEQKQKLSDEFTSWKGESEQVDDVTIIGIRV